ncbi:MAG TPA: PDZ domain-containing protein, partial [Bacteroidota bacterium]|nr:PDZ domain-containing protein [Bacteroidota bacterium]
MSLFERYPVLVRPLFGLLAALLAAAALATFIKFASTPTDENIFAETPGLLSLYVTKPIPCLDGRNGSVLPGGVSTLPGDTIRIGDLIDRVNGTPVRESSAMASALGSAPEDSILRIRAYRPSTLTFADRAVRRRDIPDSFAVFMKDFIAVTEVTSGGASDRAGLQVGDLLLKINGEGFRNPKEAELILERGQTGKAIVYEALRNNVMMRFNVTLARFGMPLALLIFSLSGMFMSAVGGFIVLKRPRLGAARVVGLALLLTGFFVAAVAIRRDFDPGLLIRIRDVMVGVSLFGGVAIVMRSMAHFPRERPDLLSKKWISWTYGAFTIVLMTLSLLKLQDAANIGLALLPVFHLSLTVAYRRGATPEQKKMGSAIRWSWGAMGSCFVGLVAYQSIIGMSSVRLDFIALTGVAVFAVSLSYLYVIGRYRLLGLNLRIRRNVQYSLVSVVWGIVMAIALVNVFFSLSSFDLHLPSIGIHGSTIEAVD